MSRRGARSAVMPWLVMGPALLAGGAAFGFWLARDGGRVWREPAAAPGRALALPSLAPIADRVRGGVVGIRTIRRPGAREVPDGDGARLAAGSRGVTNGTGFVINPDGLVVTNHHLVADHQRIVVDVPGLPHTTAELVGADPVTDVAVLRLDDPPDGLTVLALGDSTRVRQGDWVFTLGNPFQYRSSLTAGVVSYVGRHIAEEGLLVSNEYLQFDAAVFPGSSGAPVLDLRGNVVGITTSSHAEGSGISFAVPSKVLKWVLEAMERGDGRVRRGFLGIRLVPLDDATAAELGLEQAGGALVRHVEEGAPADLGGLRSGDVVVAYDGRPVPDVYTLFDWITYSEPGCRARIEVMRDWVRVPALSVELGEVDVPGAGDQNPIH